MKYTILAILAILASTAIGTALGNQAGGLIVGVVLAIMLAKRNWSTQSKKTA